MEIFLAVISHLRDCGINVDHVLAEIDTDGEDKKASIEFSVRGIRQAQEIIRSLQNVEGILNIRYKS